MSNGEYSRADSVKRLGLEIAGFIFYLYELYSLFYRPQVISIYDGSMEVFVLRLVMLLLALPLMYIFRIAYFFDYGDALSYFLSGVFKFDDSNTFFQVKLFYYAIYIMLSVLILFRTINFAYNFIS